MKTTLVLVLTTLISASAFAAGDQSSGCGLGWELFKKNSLVSSSLRASTNAMASNSVAMTSGTSGCAKHDIVMKDQAVRHYAEANYQKLLSEVAIGSGEHLSSFVAILGCHGQAGVSASQILQQNYGTIFPSDDAGPALLIEQASRSIYSTSLADVCQPSA